MNPHQKPVQTLLTRGSKKGMECYGDSREVLQDFERFYNSGQLSDVTLSVGEDRYFDIYNAHKLILVKASDVFERMLSNAWQGDKKTEIELIEDRLCVQVFPAFLRFLYVQHITLHQDNTLPILILADKYNVKSLQKVCLEYAVDHVIPNLPLKEVFHVWFQYGTKGYHEVLINACINVLSQNFQEITSSAEWEKEWLSLDMDQIGEFLKSSEISIGCEYDLWLALIKWLKSPTHPDRSTLSLEKSLSYLAPLIRFPMMSADELCQLEQESIVQDHMTILNSHLMLAYKFNSLSLESRATPAFSTAQFLLRNYTQTRWYGRKVIENLSELDKFGEVNVHVCTKASTVPLDQLWDWDVKVYPKGYSQNADEFRCLLTCHVGMDQPRAVEFMLSIVDDKSVLRSITGRKNFSKTRYTADMEVEKKVTLDELFDPSSGLLVRDSLTLQINIRPIE